MILKTRTGDVEHRAFAGTYMPSRASVSAAGVSVTPESVSGVPAVTAAVRFAAQEVAGLCLEVWRGKGQDARRAPGGWQARFLAGRPNPQQSLFDFWSTVEESLSYRGNAFVWKVYGEGGRVAAWWALHPDQVSPYWTRDAAGIGYDVVVGGGYVDPVGAGYGSYRLSSEILHFRGFGDGGSLLAPSPIQRHRDTLGAAVAKPRYEASFYANDASGGLGVVFPERVTPDQADEWRKLMTATYEGVDNRNKTKVFGGGVTLQVLGLSQADAQYVESVGMSVEEVGRIFGVPTSILDGSRGSEPITPEHEMLRWLRFGLMPRVQRIESALVGDGDLFGPAARVYPRFDTEQSIRGDLATRETIDHQKIQDGRLLVDEWRLANGLPPLPGGVGMVPQIVPVGGAPNQNAPAPAEPDDDGGERRRGHRGPVEMPQIIIQAPKADPTPVVVNVEPTPVNVNVPETVVNVSAPNVTVEPQVTLEPTFEVNPVVNVDAPVLIEAPRRVLKDVKRDAQGRITGAVIEDGDPDGG